MSASDLPSDDLSRRVLRALLSTRGQPLVRGLALDELQAVSGADPVALAEVLERLEGRRLLVRVGKRGERRATVPSVATALAEAATGAAREPVRRSAGKRGVANPGQAVRLDPTASQRVPVAPVDLAGEIVERLWAALGPRLDRIERRIELRIEERLSLLGATRTAAPAAPAGSVGEGDVLAALVEVDRRGNYGGLVPIAEVRRAVLARTGDRASFDQRLLAMERALRIDLKVADDPRIAEAGEGIHLPGRGLLFYALAPGASSTVVTTAAERGGPGS